MNPKLSRNNHTKVPADIWLMIAPFIVVFLIGIIVMALR